MFFFVCVWFFQALLGLTTGSSPGFEGWIQNNHIFLRAVEIFWVLVLGSSAKCVGGVDLAP